MLRSILSLIIGLVIIGVLVWAVGYLGAGFIDATIMVLIHRLAIVLAVIWVLYCICAMIGWVPPPSWPRGPTP